MLFTRDLRLRDLPALVAALDECPQVVPLFVLDDEVLGTTHGNANRVGFLLESLEDLRSSLRGVGADLVVRRGDWAEQVHAVVRQTAASSVHLSEDVSAFATARTHLLEDRLTRDGVTVTRHPGITVLPPGTTRPSSSSPSSSTTAGSWKVFTPYYRRWLDAPWRSVLAPPTGVRLPAGIQAGELPPLAQLAAGERSPEVARGGESEGLDRLRAWAATSLERYEDHHDDLPGDATSRISPYLHFGCLSPLEVASRLRNRAGGAAFLRQLCWRDFYHQALAARPDASHIDYRARGDVWRVDAEDEAAWKDGRTGYPIVDAAMAQLRREGFMHNRARMIVASFLTKDLYLDWRIGARHFMEWLLDGDVANNQLNWQWTAGTGSDTNPNRIFNPTVQSARFDPDGAYIRRYVPELADVGAPMIHDPEAATRTRCGYPGPIVDHHESIAAYRAQLASYRDR